MRSPLILFLGVLWTALAGFNALTSVSTVNNERERVMSSEATTSVEALASQRDGTVSFVAVASPDNPRIAHDFVLACLENRARSAAWEIEEREIPAIRVTLEDHPIKVTLPERCPRGADRNIEETHRLRWRGVEPGMALHVVGRVVETSPLELKATDYYVGTRDDHLALLDETRSTAQILNGVFVVVGLILVILGALPKAQRAKDT